MSEYLENKINSLNSNSKDYKELAPLLKDLKKRAHEAPGLSDIFKTNIKPDGKYIYFCPLNPENGVNDMDSIMSEARNWIHEMGLTEDDYEFYMTTSDMGNDGKRNREAFYNDKDLKQNDTSNKLRIMFAINQYNEGVHVPGLDGVIMGRSTQSDIIFFEQLGRALSAGKDNTKEDVDFVCTEQIENRIFDMTQAVAEGKTQYALELYADLLALKEPGMRILFLIARQMNQLLCVKEMEVGRQNKDQIAAALKVRSFVVNKLLGQARQFTIDQLIRCVERCVELEEAVKRGNMNERIAVEMVLLSIANREYHA